MTETLSELNWGEHIGLGGRFQRSDYDGSCVSPSHKAIHEVVFKPLLIQSGSGLNACVGQELVGKTRYRAKIKLKCSSGPWIVVHDVRSLRVS
jgi:hypothetical protein